LLARLGVRQREHVSVARDFSVYSTVNIVSLVLLLGTALMLRRSLGPYLAGVWTGLELLPTYVAYAHLGTLNAAERELPYLVGARRFDDFDRLKHTLFWFAHGLGLLLGGGLLVTALILRPRVSRETFVGFLLYAPIVWTQVAATFYVIVYRARKRFVQLSARQGTSNLIKAALLVSGGYLFGLYGVLGAELAAALVQMTLLQTGLDDRFERVFDAGWIKPLAIAGLPILAAGVSFEVLRGADQFVILGTLGPTPLGIYSVTAIICQGLFYLPNALSTVMYPRFQERYGETQSAASLQKFVELPLHVLADSLLAAIAVLFVALPPAITTLLTAQYASTLRPLQIMIVGTYFLCLAPPAGQFLLTVHKQTLGLMITLPVMAFGLAAAYVGASRGLTGVAIGVAIAFAIEFVALNVAAFSLLTDTWSMVKRLLEIVIVAAIVVIAVIAIERTVPLGPWPISIVGGWQTMAAGLIALPLLVRASRRIRSLPDPESVENI